MKVDQPAVALRQRADRLVDPLQVGAGEARISREEVLRVIAEGRVVDGSEQDRADRQVAQASIEGGGKSLDAAAPVGGEAGEKVVSADLKQGQRGSRRPQRAHLGRQGVHRRAVYGAV